MLNDRAVYDHNLVCQLRQSLADLSLSVRKLIVPLYLLLWEVGSSGTIQLDCSVPVAKALSHSQSVFVGEDRIDILSEIWDHYFTETLPTLQAIFYPVQVILI